MGGWGREIKVSTDTNRALIHPLPLNCGESHIFDQTMNHYYEQSLARYCEEAV